MKPRKRDGPPGEKNKKKVYGGLVGAARECREVGPVQERSRGVPSKHAGESINFATLVSSGPLLGKVGRCVTTPCADFGSQAPTRAALGAPLVVQVWRRPELFPVFFCCVRTTATARDWPARPKSQAQKKRDARKADQAGIDVRR